jgi:SAM-dependent methyltransferase
VIQEPGNVNIGPGTKGAEGREQVFWDEHVASLADCVNEYVLGPDAHTNVALDALEPLSGCRVLDFACGPGVTSAWLAARGAEVLGMDVSARSIERARELCERLGLRARFVATSLDSFGEGASFDRIFGRFALHHVDCDTVGLMLARLLKPHGRATFVETMDSNPILRIARRHAVGRFGIPRYGTLDEHPLTDADLDSLRLAFGGLRVEVPQLTFFRIADRQLLRRRSPRASRMADAIDDFLLACGMGSWSYHQVLVLTRDGE